MAALRDRQASELEESMIALYQSGRITEESLARVKTVMSTINKLLVGALKWSKLGRSEPKNWTPLPSLSTDGTGDVIKNLPGRTNFVDELLNRPYECDGYTVWELFHATIFDENPS